MIPTFGKREGCLLQSVGKVQLWQLPYHKVEEAVRKAYSVYEKVFAPFDKSITEKAFERYKNWFPGTIMLAYLANEKIIATSCLTVKQPGITFPVEDDFLAYASANAIDISHHRLYYGSMSSVDKEMFQRLHMQRSMSFGFYRQMNWVLATVVAQDEKAIYLADFEQVAFSLLNRSLGMGWKKIGKENRWLNSYKFAAYLPQATLRQWIEKHKETIFKDS